jgi:sec-independent protein translocase protein TatB
MMKRMSFSETVFLFVLALVIFGPKKLPEIARQVGKWMNEFRRASNEFKSQIEQEIAHIEVEERKRSMLPPSPTPEGTASRTLEAPATEGAGSSDVKSEGKAPENGAEPPATLASTEESVPVQHSTEPATEALPPAETVTSTASRESHA